MKRLFTKIGRWLIWIAAAAALLGPLSAMASGEHYYWQDSSRRTVIGQDGNIKQPLTLNLDNTQPPQTYSGTTADGCQISLTINPSDYAAKTDPAPATVSATPCDLDGGVTVAANKEAASAATSNSQSVASPKLQCTADNLGWLFCGIYKWVLQSIDWIERNVIIPFLEVSPVPAGTNTPTYQIWFAVKNLANVLFLLAFIIAIFAQITSVWLDSYSIKKLLPRLVLAAIFVQFSYVLVALAVDISNIIGRGLGQLLLAPLHGQNIVHFTDLVGGLGIAGLLAAAVGVAGGILSGTILISVIGAFFTLLAVFLTLVARQILITFLLIVSPIAFVLWLFPNTEHLFAHWHRTLLRLLMMYPLIVMLFVSGKIFAAATVAGAGGGAANDQLRSLISVAANLVPLFLVPLTFKYAGVALSNIGSLIGTITNHGRVRTESSTRYERLKTMSEQRRRDLAAGQGVTFSAFGRTARMGTSKAATQIVGRGLFGNHAKSGSIHSMLNFSLNRSAAADELKKEGTTFETYQVLSRGIQWGQVEVEKARMNGDSFKAEQYQRAIEAARFRGRAQNSSYRAAASAFLKDVGQIGESDRVAISGGYIKDQYGNKTIQVKGWQGSTDAGRRIGRQVWNDVREGMRKINPGVTYTNIDGTENTTDRIKWILGQNQGTLANMATDAFEKMRDDGTLELMSKTVGGRKTLAGLIGGGGPQAGPAQQAIIRQVFDPPDIRNVGTPPDPAPYGYVKPAPDNRVIPLRTPDEARRYKNRGEEYRLIQVEHKDVPSIDEL